MHRRTCLDASRAGGASLKLMPAMAVTGALQNVFAQSLLFAAAAAAVRLGWERCSRYWAHKRQHVADSAIEMRSVPCLAGLGVPYAVGQGMLGPQPACLAYLAHMLRGRQLGLSVRPRYRPAGSQPATA